MIHRQAVKEIKKEKKLFLQLMLLSAVVTLCMIVQAYGISTFLNAFFLGQVTVEEGLDKHFSTLIMVLAVIVGRMLFSYLQERTAQDLALYTKRHIRDRLLDHLFKLGPLQQTMQGEVAHLLTDGLDKVESYIARYVPQMMYAVFIPLFMAIAMMTAVSWIGIILLITYPLIPFFMILIGKKAGKMNEAQWERMSFLSGHFLDVLQGLTTLKLFNRAEEQEQVVGRLSREFRDSTLKVLQVAFLSAFVLELISTISTAIIAVYLGVALIYGEVEYFPAFFILLLAPEFYVPLRELGSAFHTGMGGEVALKKADEFLSIPVQEPTAVEAEEMEMIVEGIRFEDVTFTYAGRDIPAVEHLSFTLSKEARTMIVGESGAGKSTISLLLLRLLAPQSGRMIVYGTCSDGSFVERDLQDWNGDAWREQIAFMAQKSYLFAGSIYDNIVFGMDGVTKEEVESAAKKAEAYDFIMAHPEGFGRTLGEGGMGLSGGEVQRIALARAFLKKAQILILDEASAHLDVETEELISKAMERLMEEKVVLLIGHRLQTLSWAEQVLVMRRGQVQERGTVSELMKQNGYFSVLAKEGLFDERSKS